MNRLEITTLWNGQAGDQELFEQLRRDIEMQVGPVERDTVAVPGAKGAMLGTIASMAIAIISSQALAALVGILRSHLERGREYEMEISGPGGTIKLKGADARRLTEGEFRETLQQILGKA